jgi:hypothetical protein
MRAEKRTKWLPFDDHNYITWTQLRGSQLRKVVLWFMIENTGSSTALVKESLLDGPLFFSKRA